MRLPHQDNHGTERKPTNVPATRLGLIGVLFSLTALVAWLYPAAKPDAVLGRLSYFQFWSAMILTSVAGLLLVVRASPNRLRRAIGFRLTAVWLAFLFVLAIGELVAFILPAKHQMDNPWYLAAGGGTSESVDLPFERPPHLKWEGMSRGDLALLNGDADPYARTVTFETDMDGFRNSRDLSQADLVVIGDSFTEAGNVMEAESFSALAGKQSGMSVRNLGRAGYTAATELIVLKKYGLKCRPKVVVWQIAESNDLAEMQVYANWVAAGRPRYFDVKPRNVRFKAWQSRSPSFKLFDLLRENTSRPWPLGGTFKGEDGIDFPVRFLSMPSLEPPVRGHPAWPAFAETLLEAAAVCRAQNIRLLVLFIPTKSRVMAPHSKLTPLAQAAFDRVEGDSLGTVLKQYCASHDIQFIDPTERLLEEAKAGRLVYLPYDTHLSPKGHQVIADLISSNLSSP